jgi:hypothetical protein
MGKHFYSREERILKGRQTRKIMNRKHYLRAKRERQLEKKAIALDWKNNFVEMLRKKRDLQREKMLRKNPNIDWQKIERIRRKESERNLVLLQAKM